MYEIINVGGVPGGEAFLLKTEGGAALIDAGFGFSATKTIKNIEAHLAGKSLDYILLTHSHYDHVSGSPYILRRYPKAKVVAGEYAARVFTRPNALKVIKEMNDNAAKQYGFSDYPEPPFEIKVDIAVKEGDIIRIGQMAFRVLEVPGHTKCSIAFFCEDESLLIGSETFGVPDDQIEYVVPCNLVGYEMTINSIKKARACNAQSLLIPHWGVLSGQKIEKFFELSLDSVEKAKNMILEGYETGMDLEELIMMFKSAYFTENLAKYQPEAAFMLNASYMIPMILRECMGVEL